MSHKTRMEATVRDLKRRGIPPDAPEAVNAAARARASRYLHPPRPTLISVRREVEEAVKARTVAMQPLTAPEAIALLLKVMFQAATLSAYLLCLPFFRGWQAIKRRVKKTPVTKA